MRAHSHLRALIISPPGRNREGLRALIAAMAQFGQLTVTDDWAAAWQRAAEPPPDLILVNLGLPGLEITDLVLQLKTKWPAARCMVLEEAG